MWLSRGEGDARCLEKIIRPVVNFTQDGFSYSTPGGGGRSSDHEEAERTPRQNSHVWFFFGREQKTEKERRDETRRGMREMTKWKKCERAEQKWRGWWSKSNAGKVEEVGEDGGERRPGTMGRQKGFLTKSERLHTHTARAHTHRNMHAILSRFRKSCFI